MGWTRQNRTAALVWLAAVLWGLVVQGQAAVVGQWDFDSNASDTSGNNNHGTVYGTPVWGAGTLVFDGVDDYIGIPGSSGWDFSDGFVLEARVRITDDDGDSLLMDKHVSDIGEGYFLGVRETVSTSTSMVAISIQLRFTAQRSMLVSGTTSKPSTTGRSCACMWMTW